jgi:hypothetical protein
MRLGRSLFFIFAGALVLAVMPAGLASAATCTGNTVVQQAPYTCTASRTIQGITVLATLNVDANGRAEVDFTLDAPAPSAVAIAVHSWIGIDTGPDIVRTGTIPVGATTGQLLIDQIQCGQLDIKAVAITPGQPSGTLGGPVVHWGNECRVPPTTVAPTSVAPTTVAPPTSNSVLPTSIAPSTTNTVLPTSIAPSTTNVVLPTSVANTTPTTMPHTGVDLVTPATWALVAITAGAALLLIARRWKADGVGED